MFSRAIQSEVTKMSFSQITRHRMSMKVIMKVKENIIIYKIGPLHFYCKFNRFQDIVQRNMHNGFYDRFCNINSNIEMYIAKVFII